MRWPRPRELSLFVVRGLQAIYFFNLGSRVARGHAGLARECLCESRCVPAHYGQASGRVGAACVLRARYSRSVTANQWKARLSSTPPGRSPPGDPPSRHTRLVLPMAATPSRLPLNPCRAAKVRPWPPSTPPPACRHQEPGPWLDGDVGVRAPDQPGHSGIDLASEGTPAASGIVTKVAAKKGQAGRCRH